MVFNVVNFGFIGCLLLATQVAIAQPIIPENAFVLNNIATDSVARASVCDAQNDNLKTQNDSTISLRKSVLKVLPLAFYTPETRIAGELVAYYSFFTTGAQRKSNVRFFATYTQNKQFFVSICLGTAKRVIFTV